MPLSTVLGYNFCSENVFILKAAAPSLYTYTSVHIRLLMILINRLVLLVVETLTLMLRESEIFACRVACIKTDDGAVVKQLITLLVKRPMDVDHLADSEQVRQRVSCNSHGRRLMPQCHVQLNN